MKTRPLPSAEYLRSRLYYDPETGIFTWRHSEEMSKKWNNRFAGKVAGNLNKTKGQGYVTISINYISYRAHRLAWLYVTGNEPMKHIDHINRDRSDNRFVNLREASRKDNQQNGSGCKRTVNFGLPRGVRPVGKVFDARVKAGGCVFYFGTYPTAEEAGKVAKQARETLHGPFAYHGEAM